jgi:SNF2 family DNA or RNA helicase
MTTPNVTSSVTENITPRVIHLDIRKQSSTRVIVTLAKDVYFPPHSFNDFRHNTFGSGFNIPLEETPNLYNLLTSSYKHLNFTIDSHTSTYIESVLNRERLSYDYAVANEAPEIDHTLGPITLRPFQAAAFRYLNFNQDNKILALDMGLGKTAVSIKLVEENKYRTIFLTKAALVHNLDREIRKLTNSRPVILGGRIPDETCMRALFTKEFRYFILNYEVVGTEIVEEKDGKEITSHPWANLFNTLAAAGMLDCIVADEAHSFKNMKAKRTKAILKMNAPRKLPMTGTPLVNRLPELFPLLHWVAPNSFPSEQSFLNTYANGSGAPRNPEKLQKALLPYMFRRAKRDVLTDLPPINRITHSVSLSPLHAERYKSALEGIYKTIDGKEIDIQNALVQLNRLRQIVADAKADHTVEYVQNFLEETDEKILVFSNFTLPVRQVAAEIGCDVIFGDVPLARRMQMVDKFTSDPSTRVLCLTIPTGQEGLNITAASTIYFNDLAWTPKDHTQAEARAYGRLNDVHGATSVYAEINGTVDAFMNELLQRKAAIIEAAVEGTKEYAQAQQSVMMEVIQYLKNNR